MVLEVDMTERSIEETAVILNGMTSRLEEKLLPLLEEWRNKEVQDPITAGYLPDAVAMSVAIWICSEITMWLGGNIGPEHRHFAGHFLNGVADYLDGMLYDGPLKFPDEELDEADWELDETVPD